MAHQPPAAAGAQTTARRTVTGWAARALAWKTVIVSHNGTSTSSSVGSALSGGTSASHPRACSLIETSSPDGVEHQQTRLVQRDPQRLAGGLGPGAEGVTERLGQVGEQLRVAGRERRLTVAAHQRDRPPRGVAGAQYGAQLVLEAEWAQERPVPAAPARIVDRSSQGAGGDRSGRQIGEQVDVLAEQLAPPVLRALGRADALDAVEQRRPVGQAGRRVGADPRRGVERDQLAQSRRRGGEHASRAVRPLDAPQQVISMPACHAGTDGRGHDSSLRVFAARDNPPKRGPDRARHLDGGWLPPDRQSAPVEGSTPANRSGTVEP